MARLVFLGRLEDLAGKTELEIADGDTLAAALGTLSPSLREAVAEGKVRFALNGAVLAAATDPATVTLGRDDELALLPPVSGG